jgi:transposase-like protein
MECPECHGTHIRKNGHRQHKQNYICVKCGRQFLEHDESRGYGDDVKQLCLKMYPNGMGIRGISRVTEISHVTILNWMKQSGAQVPDSYDPKSIPQVGELDEHETFVGNKQNKRWIWTVFLLVGQKRLNSILYLHRRLLLTIWLIFLQRRIKIPTNNIGLNQIGLRLRHLSGQWRILHPQTQKISLTQH